MTALHDAAYNADTAAVQLLLTGGASVDARDEKGFTPLLWSCFRGAVGDQAPVAQALIQAGADPNAKTSAGDANCLILAVQSGARSVIEAVIEGGASVNGSANDVTPLMIATMDGDQDVVAYLMEIGADPTVRCGNYTAADYAWHGGHDELAEFLRRPHS
jgi:ankyrin repeat protein